MSIANLILTILGGWGYQEYSLENTIGYSVFAFAFAALIWRLAPYVVSKMFADYADSCPKCRFSLENFRADRCPECGLYLGEDFHAPPLPSQSESPSE